MSLPDPSATDRSTPVSPLGTPQAKRTQFDLFRTYYRINRTTTIGADLSRFGAAVDALRLTLKVRKVR